MRVIYNGIDLMVMETYAFDCEAVYDDSGTDYLYTKVTLVVRAMINGQADIVPLQPETKKAGAGVRLPANNALNGPGMSYDWDTTKGSARFDESGNIITGAGPQIDPTRPNTLPPLRTKGTIPPDVGIDASPKSNIRGIRIIPNPPDLTHQVIRHRLLTPRGKLYIFSGPGMEQGVPAAGDSASPAGNIAAKDAAIARLQAKLRRRKVKFTGDFPGAVIFPPAAPGQPQIGKQAIPFVGGAGGGDPAVVSDAANLLLTGAGTITSGFIDALFAAILCVESPEGTAVCDCKNGPKPQILGVHTALGDATTLLVDWAVETYINEGPINNINPTGALLANRFAQTHTVGEDGYTSVITNGMAIFRTDRVYTLPESPDTKRPIIFMPINQGFVRSIDYVRGRPDVSGIEYGYVDRQVKVNFPAGPYAKAASIAVVHRQAVSANVDILGGVFSLYERTLGLLANRHFAKGDRSKDPQPAEPVVGPRPPRKKAPKKPPGP